MISVDKVEESILELERADTCFSVCEKLAYLYIVRDHLKGYEVSEAKIDSSGNSEFLKLVNGKNADAVWKVIDETMQAIKILHPKMYDKVIDKIESI